jgi:hypothetical protein
MRRIGSKFVRGLVPTQPIGLSAPSASRAGGASGCPRCSDHTTDGEIDDRQVAKSAFELDWAETLPAGRRTALRGRSWSPGARIVRVDVSTDGGRRWKRARLTHVEPCAAWQRWTIDWRPEEPGTYQLSARATDSRGVTQPAVNPYNTLGHLFGAVVRHPVALT